MVSEIPWDIITDNLDLFLRGAVLTLEISILGIILGFSLAVPLALGRLSKFLPSKWIATGYVEAIRGTPLLVQIFVIYFGLRASLLAAGVDFSPFAAGVLAIGLNSAAYQAEIIRGGIESVPKGQMEAARSIGMTRMQAMRYVILPQGFRLMLPSMTNEFIILIKDTSLVSVISVTELTYWGRQINAIYFEPFLVFFFIALVYFIMTFTTSKLLRIVERKYKIPGYGEEE
jgi:ectoine/hydroxyectoine ABC transporter permease protein EhuC